VLPGEGKPVRLAPVKVTGGVAWKGHTFENIHLLVASLDWQPLQYLRPAADTGEFTTELPPGQYVLLAFADLNETGEVDAGDRVWSYGSKPAPGTSEPPPLPVAAQEEQKPLLLTYAGIVRNDGAVMSDDGKRVLFQLNLPYLPALVTGRIVWPEPITRGSVSVSRDVTFARTAAETSVIGPDGTFRVALRPGEYYASAMVDLDGDDRLGPGDVVGFYGLTDFASGAPPAALHASAGRLMSGVEIRMTARLDREGKPEPTAQ
jgi:hypothetical protein